MDDSLVAAADPRGMEIFLKKLKSKFKIVSRKAEYILGLEIREQGNGFKISQQGYVKKVLGRFNFSECRLVSTPILKSPEVLCEEKGKQSNFPYLQAIGALMYLMLGTRPDLEFCIVFLSRYLKNPTAENIAQVKTVFRYLAGTADFGIVYRKIKRKILECYIDADFGGCTKTGRTRETLFHSY